MKTIFLPVIMILLGLSVVAQQSAPPGNEPENLFRMHRNSVVRPDNGNAKRPAEGNPSPVPKSIAPQPSQPSTFDPSWAWRFQTVLDSVQGATGVKGLSAAVLVPGMGIWTGASGLAGTGIPMTTERRFGIASNTKLFTAVTLAKLQQEGILSLDDHLYQWIPSFPDVDSTTTIRQLLTHQSGIFDFWNDNINGFWNMILADTSHFFTPQEVLATIGPSHFPPGHGYRYSNTNYLLAGMVIEAATGQSYAANLHNVIFDPLTMDSTFVGAIESKNGPVAHEWVWNLGEVAQAPMTSAYSSAYAGFDLLSTAQEMVEWYSVLLGGGLLPDAALTQILDIEPASTYGMGIYDWEINDHKCYVHGGAQVGDLSQMIYDRQTKSVFCVMTNSRENFSFGNIIFPLLDVLWNECPKKLYDAGITRVVSPWENGCSPSVTPEVTLQNFASQPMTSVSINYKIDGGTVFSYPWTGNLVTGASVDVTLPAVTATNGLHFFTCFTSNPNGNPEGYNYNDTASSSFIVNTSVARALPMEESFDDGTFPPDGWTQNRTSVYCWGRTTLAAYSGTGSAVKANYEDGSGSNWDLDLPLLDFGSVGSPVLSFTYAYARYPGLSDSLLVMISPDCGASWQVLFDKGGSDLATSPTTQQAFFPQSYSQWKNEVIPLSGYTGNVLIRFRNVNGFGGNNLYLDDVSVAFPTGIAGNNASGKISVYPNPATGLITVSGLPVNSEIQIMDLTGKLLMTMETMNTTATFDIRNLPQGLYFIRSMNGETTGIGKFIKQ
jgi:CubicO group peptidase (beta-lactamase class C family)